MTAADDVRRARRYLLGQATPQEVTDIEEEYLADDDAVAHIAAIESDLIEDYLDGRLGVAERQQFEQSYLASPRHRARVEAVRRLRAAATAERPRSSADDRGSVADDGAPARDKRGSTVIRWKPWLALAATLVLATATGAMLSRSAVPAAVSSAAPAAPGAAPAAVAAGARDGSVGGAPTSILAINLAPIGVRGAADRQPPAIPEETARIRLHLQRDANTPPFVPARVVVRSMSGEERWSGAVDGTPAAGATVADVEIPGTLSPDDYLVTLMAAEPRGGEREWLQYLLRIRRP